MTWYLIEGCTAVEDEEDGNLYLIEGCTYFVMSEAPAGGGGLKAGSLASMGVGITIFFAFIGIGVLFHGG